MFNSRIDKIQLTTIRRYSEAAHSRPDGIDLAIGDLRGPHFATPAHIRDAAKTAMDEGMTHYPPLQGIPELRRAIAGKLKSYNGIEADPDAEVLVTVGATEALYCAMASILRPGDEVLIPDPCHDIYAPMAHICEAKPVRVPWREEDGFRPTREGIFERITPRTRALWVNAPHSPSGAVLDREALEEIASVAREKDIWVIADEPYERFVYDGAKHLSIASLEGMRERTASAHAFSKTYAMTGWRLGYLSGPPDLIERALKVHRNIVSGVNLISQWAGIAALEGPPDEVEGFVKTLEESREVLVKALQSAPGIRCTMPRGTFYAYPNVSGLGLTSKDFADRLLEEKGVAVVPGDAWGAYLSDEFVRISYSHPPEVVAEGAGRIAEFAEKIQ